MSKSIVEYYPNSESHRCGYCKSPNTNCSQGMWTYLLTVEDYQSLIDRGWRRSGKYCYKPKMAVTCCPMYTIKCDILEFKLSKSQKKVLKKVNKHLLGGDAKDDLNSLEIGNSKQKNEGSGSSQENAECEEHFNALRNKKHSKIDIKNIVPSVSETTKVMADYDHTTPCKKAKQLRYERKKEKLIQKGIEWKPQQKKTAQGKSIEDIFSELPSEFRNRLKVKVVRTSPPSPEWLATMTASHKLYIKYQMAIHGDPIEKCTEKQYKSFLVTSPLKAEFPDDGPPMGYGSFHQQYWLDDALIAVGVIDILPKCVSSVYFYYDPDFSHLSLGTYGALNEIVFTRELEVNTPNIKYYYMGYYIHTCPKMIYKGNYTPSYLLCPETYNWFPLEECRKKLDVLPYTRLNPNLDDTDTDYCEEKDLKDILVLVGNKYMKFDLYKSTTVSKFGKVIAKEIIDEKSTLEYARFVGKTCSQRILLYKE